MKIVFSLTGPKVYRSPDSKGRNGRVVFKTEFLICFNRKAYYFFNDLRKSNVDTLFRDLNINKFIFWNVKQIFENLSIFVI